jgi:uncharacterized protein with FMN-binding domain
MATPSPKRSVVTITVAAGALILLLSFKTPAGTDVSVLGSLSPGGPNSSPAASARPGSSAAAGGGDGTFAGVTSMTPFGPVQVQITIAGGRITDVKPLQLPSDRQRSAAIAAYSAPILRSEALSAQSAQIDLVSGATYTSEGYAQSLQSALDAAHR